MFFKDIIGHESLKNRLVQTVKENRVSHAWLFFGAEGTGALPVALAFAGYILCNNSTDNDACGICTSCNKVQKYIHPDLHFVYPVNKTKGLDKDSVTSADFSTEWRTFLLNNPYGRLTQWFDAIELENKQGLITAEESKQLSSKLFLKSFESDYKIAIIWLPEKMNDQAANKLLKLLEEPPPMTIFMLVSENPDQLLTTVKSRCMPVKVPRISDEDISLFIKEKFTYSNEECIEITRLSEGNYVKMQEIIHDGGSDYNLLNFRDLMRYCFKSNVTEIMKLTEEIAALTREKQKSFLEYGLRTVRESLALHFNADELAFISGEGKTFTTNFAPFVHGKNVTFFTHELNKAIMDIERNANGRIVLLDMALKIMALIRPQARG
jgi:DNA polymerase III subunit delta'